MKTNTTATKYELYREMRKTRAAVKAAEKAENLAQAKEARKNGTKKARVIRNIKFNGFGFSELED